MLLKQEDIVIGKINVSFLIKTKNDSYLLWNQPQHVAIKCCLDPEK